MPKNTQASYHAGFLFASLPVSRGDAMKIYFIVFVLCMIWLVTSQASAERSLNTVDKCTAFDSWVGGERFDYEVDAQGNWNLPVDTDLLATISFPNAGIWKYYSAQTDTSYVIVFLSFEPSQPTGKRLGQHDICVYKLQGMGMSVN